MEGCAGTTRVREKEVTIYFSQVELVINCSNSYSYWVGWSLCVVIVIVIVVLTIYLCLIL